MGIPRSIELKPSKGGFILRPPSMEDASAIFEAIMISLDDLIPWMDWCERNYSIDLTLEWLERQPSEWDEGLNYQFALFDDLNNQFLGACGINHINRYYLLANLGYWIRSDRKGEGIATEATHQVAKFGFERLGLQRVEIVAAEENWASRRVAEKAGATFEGILRRRLRIDDKNLDAAMHSLVPEDLE
jgi:ribosomal-protein-serine acetyltransferase